MATNEALISEGFNRAAWCKSCKRHQLHRALDNEIFECAVCHTKHHSPMSDREWMLKYAPHGYRYMRTRLTFETLDRAVCPAGILTIELDRLKRKMEREIDGRFESSVFTRVTV